MQVKKLPTQHSLLWSYLLLRLKRLKPGGGAQLMSTTFSAKAMPLNLSSWRETSPPEACLRLRLKLYFKSSSPQRR